MTASGKTSEKAKICMDAYTKKFGDGVSAKPLDIPGAGVRNRTETGSPPRNLEYAYEKYGLLLYF